MNSFIPIHQWTHDGDEVFIVRFCDKEGKTYNQYVPKEGFQYPLKVGDSIAFSDWNGKPGCGGGGHGWPWGLFIGDGKEAQWDQVWQVYGVKPKDVIPVESDFGKVKFRCGILRFSGDWWSATNFVLAGQMAWVHARTNKSQDKSADERGASSATGDGGASSATGDGGASSATGPRGASSATGDGGASSATGPRGASSATGPRGASSATGCAAASSATGDCSGAFCTGLNSKARGGKFSAIALAWWNQKSERAEMRCALIGCGDGTDGQLKADVWYRINAEGTAFVEVAE